MPTAQHRQSSTGMSIAGPSRQSCGRQSRGTIRAPQVVRAAKPQDYPTILALARGAAEAGDAFLWEPSISDDELAAQWLPQPRLRRETFVCEADGVDGIAGACLLHPAAAGRGAHIAQAAFVVTPAARGRGLGKALCSRILQEAKDRGYVGMQLGTVVATNVAMVRVCAGCGFRVMCTLPKAFRHPRRGLVDIHMMFHGLEDFEAAAATTAGAPAAAAAPTGVSYPAAAGGASYTVGEDVRLEPRLSGGCMASGSFTVQPALPDGLAIDGQTGVIHGAAKLPCDATTYRITASLSAELTLQVEEPDLAINEDFATRLESVADVKDLLPEPTRTKCYGNWMIWMVHRAWLNDPTLLDFNFNNMHMPAPEIEPRIAPKLMLAMATNTYIEVLSLSNSNVQKAQGLELAAALPKNGVLRTLNLESNWLDSSTVRELALAIKANNESKIEHLRFSHQKQMGQFFGRPTEEAVGQMMERNETIVKLGFECDDAHWRNLIDRALLRNNDCWRRRQHAGEGGEDLPPAEDRTLGHLLLKEAPEVTSMSKFFPEETPAHVAFRSYVFQTRKLPTTSQLQMCAKNSGTTLPYTVAAPLIRECRAWLLDASVGREVVVTDAFGTGAVGTLRCWSETNDNWNLDICGGGKRYTFRSNREPAFSVSGPLAAAMGGGIPGMCGQQGGPPRNAVAGAGGA